MTTKFLAGNQYLTNDLKNITPSGDEYIRDNINSQYIDLLTGKIKSIYFPKILLSNIYVVSDIEARDELITSLPISAGDTVKVIGDSPIPEVYIWSGTEFVSVFSNLSMSTLLDVIITNPQNKDLITYNENSSMYINQKIDTSYLADLIISPGTINGDVLKYLNNQFITSENTFTSLQDTDIIAPQNNQFIKYLNNKFTNMSLSLGEVDFGNIEIDNLIQSQVLTYNGTKWINSTPFTNPLTTQGSIMVRDNFISRGLPLGLDRSILTSNAITNLPEWKLFNLHDIENINITSPQNDDGIVYNVTQNKWINQQLFKTPLKNQGDIFTRDGISDTALSIGVTGSVLMSNGLIPGWVEIPNIDTILPIFIETPQSTNILKYDQNTSKWINHIPTTDLLQDINTNNLTNNDILIRGSDGRYINKQFILDNLINTSISAPKNDQIIKYNHALGKWVNGGLNLIGIENIELNNPTDEDTLTFDSLSNKWKNTVPFKDLLTTSGDIFYKNGLVTSRLARGFSKQVLFSSNDSIMWDYINIDKISDIDLINQTDDDVLSYDVTNSKWVNKQPLKSPLLTAGDIWTFNTQNTRLPIGANNSFLRVVNDTLQYQIINNIDNIIKTDIINPITNNYLKYDQINDKWINGVIQLTNIFDVNISTPQTNQVLTFNGSKWINQTPSGGSGSGLPTPIGGPGQIVQSDGSIASWSTQFPRTLICDTLVSSIILSTSASPTYSSGCFFLETSPQGTRTCQNAISIGFQNRLTGGNNNTLIGLNMNSLANQGTNNIAIGSSCLFNSGALVSDTISLGSFCNRNLLTTSNNVISLGNFCNFSNITLNNSIMLNASGNATQGISQAFIVKPVRSLAATTNIMYYNTSSGEVSYNTGASSQQIKKDVTTVILSSNIYSDIQNLNLVDYRFLNQTSDDPLSRGFIAESMIDLENFNDCLINVPEITIGEQTFLNIPGIDYQKLTLTLFPIIKKMAQDISTLTNKITFLSSENERMSEELLQLQSGIYDFQ